VETVPDITFDKLLKSVNGFSADQLALLKQAIAKKEKDNNLDAFRSLLLNGRIFSKKQLDNIAKTRKAFNQWRAIKY
jgi:hypothetical protein